MKILALDSSGIVASVAVVEDDTLLAEYTVNYKKTHSQTLLGSGAADVGEDGCGDRQSAYAMHEAGI